MTVEVQLQQALTLLKAYSHPEVQLYRSMYDVLATPIVPVVPTVPLVVDKVDEVLVDCNDVHNLWKAIHLN